MHKTWTPIISTLGTVFTSLLSCAACPACLPIYAGLLSLLGFELFEINTYFFPIMIAFLTVTIGLMATQVLRRKANPRPLMVAGGAAAFIVWGSLVGNEVILYLSLAAFMVSVFWNKNLIKKSSCGGGCCSGSAA